MQHDYFDFTALNAVERYKLLSGSVLPRPIALVTSVDGRGIINAAPFSFFGVLSHDPPVLAIGIENRPDGTLKDTARNIGETHDFTVHIPDVSLIDGVEICASPVAAEVNELDLAGLQFAEGRAVRSPRILAAPVALECRLKTKIELGPARDIIIGEVVGLFVRSDAVNDRMHIDSRLIDAIGRLGGALYATTREHVKA